MAIVAWPRSYWSIVRYRSASGSGSTITMAAADPATWRAPCHTVPSAVQLPPVGHDHEVPLLAVRCRRAAPPGLEDALEVGVGDRLVGVAADVAAGGSASQVSMSGRLRRDAWRTAAWSCEPETGGRNGS